MSNQIVAIMEVKLKSFEDLLKYIGSLEKDDDKNLMPEKTAILYKKLMAEWWSM